MIYIFVAHFHKLILLFSEPLEPTEAVPFFDLKGIVEVKQLQPEEEANSIPITIPGGMLVADRRVAKLYVSYKLSSQNTI